MQHKANQPSFTRFWLSSVFLFKHCLELSRSGLNFAPPVLQSLHNIKPQSALKVVAFALLLRTPMAFLPAGKAGELIYNTPFFPELFTRLSGMPLLNNILATLLVSAAALLLNRICVNQDVIYTHSYLPAWFYILISSLDPWQYSVHPVMISNLLILAGFHYLFSLFLYEGPSGLIYLTGVCFGAASVFRIQLIVLVIFMLGAIILMKRITLRDVLASLLGMAMPIYLLLGIRYVGQVPLRIGSDAVQTGGMQTEMNLMAALWPVLVVYALVLLSFAKVALNYYKNNIRTRRINQVLVFYTIYQTLVLLLLQAKTIRVDISLIFVPAAVYIAYLLIGHKYKRYKELGNVLLIAVAIMGAYGSSINALF
jgi:hypothetical protein